MTVLHIATTLDGGAGIGLMRYHQALLGAGVDSRILVRNLPQWADKRFARIPSRSLGICQRLARKCGLRVSSEASMRGRVEALDQAAGPIDGYELFTPPFSSSYFPEEHSWIDEADVVNLHWCAGVLDWPRFFNRVKKPVVLTLHDQQPYLGGFHYALDARNNPHLAEIEAEVRTIKQSALRGHRIGVIANSKWNAGEARVSGFFSPQVPIETIYYPLDASVFQPRPRNAAKAAFGIDPSRKVIGFACEDLNNKRKGFSELLDALTQLRDDVRSEVTLLSFGRDPTPEMLRRFPLPWVQLGYLNADTAKVAAYSAMDVFVAPSRAEAFGLTALESQAVGTPVVATAVGGLVEALVYGETVRSEKECVHCEIRNAIVAVLCDQEPTEHWTNSGRQMLIRRHSPGDCARQLSEHYDQVICPQ